METQTWPCSTPASCSPKKSLSASLPTQPPHPSSFFLGKQSLSMCYDYQINCFPPISPRKNRRTNKFSWKASSKQLPIPFTDRGKQNSSSLLSFLLPCHPEEAHTGQLQKVLEEPTSWKCHWDGWLWCHGREGGKGWRDIRISDLTKGAGLGIGDPFHPWEWVREGQPTSH